jgi:hypothetical protein
MELWRVSHKCQTIPLKPSPFILPSRYFRLSTTLSLMLINIPLLLICFSMKFALHYIVHF